MVLSIKGNVWRGKFLLVLFMVSIILSSPAFVSESTGQAETHDLGKGQDPNTDENKGDVADAISTLLQPKSFLHLAGLIATVLGTVFGVLWLFIRFGIGSILYKALSRGTERGIQKLVAEQEGTDPLFSGPAVKEGIREGMVGIANSALKNETFTRLFSAISGKISELNDSLSAILERIPVGSSGAPIKSPKRTYGYGVEDIIKEIDTDFEQDYEELAEALKFDLTEGERVATKLLEEKYNNKDKKRAIIILELANIYHESKSDEEIEKGLAILDEAGSFKLDDNRINGLICFLRATLYRDKREYPSALQHIEEAKDLFPENPHILKELAFLYWFIDDRAAQGTGRIDQLIGITKKALQFARRDSFTSFKILNNLCYFLSMRADMPNKPELQRKEDIKEVLEICETFRQMESSKRSWLDTRGFCYLVAYRVLGKEYYIYEAEKVLEQARKGDPSNPWTLAHLAEVKKILQSLK